MERKSHLHRLMLVVLVMVLVSLACQPFTLGGPSTLAEAYLIAYEAAFGIAGPTDPVIMFQYPELLVAGDMLASYRYDSQESTGYMLDVTEDTWLFWVDDFPGARFAHPTRFITVGASSDEVIVTAADWWPVLNDTSLWVEKTDYWDTSNWAFSNLGEEIADKMGLGEQIPEIAAALDQVDQFLGGEIIDDIGDPVICDVDDPIEDDEVDIYRLGWSIQSDGGFFASADVVAPELNLNEEYSWATLMVFLHENTVDAAFLYENHAGEEAIGQVDLSNGEIIPSDAVLEFTTEPDPNTPFGTVSSVTLELPPGFIDLESVDTIVVETYHTDDSGSDKNCDQLIAKVDLTAKAPKKTWESGDHQWLGSW